MGVLLGNGGLDPELCLGMHSADANRTCSLNKGRFGINE